MALESKIGIDKNIIFRETFNSESDIIRNGGTITNVDISKGIATLGAEPSNILYPLTYKGDVISYRIRFKHSGYVENAYQLAESNIEIRIYLDTDQFEVIIADSFNYYNAYITYTFEADKWYEIVFTYNKNEVDDYNKASFYINGEYFYPESVDSSDVTNIDINYNYIGGNGSAALIGDIDLFEIYNRVLSASEISDLYNNIEYKSTSSNVALKYSQQTTDNSIIFKQLFHSADAIAYNKGVASNVTYLDKYAIFNGTNSVVELRPDILAGATTISCFYKFRIKSYEGSTIDVVFGNYNPSGGIYQSFIFNINQGRLRVYCSAAAANNYFMMTTNDVVLTLNKWHIISYSVNLPNQTCTFMVDGVVCAANKTNVGTPPTSVLSSTIPNTFARWGQSGNTYYVNMDMEFFNLYKRELSISEMTNLYNDINNKPVNIPNKLLHYTIENGTERELVSNQAIVKNAPLKVKDSNVYSNLFNGTTNYIAFPNTYTLFKNAEIISASCWFKHKNKAGGTSDVDALISFRGGLTKDVKFIIFSNINDGRVYLYTATNSATLPLYQTPLSYADNIWHHIYASINYITKNYSIYIDGKLIVSSNDATICTYNSPTLDTCAIGMNSVPASTQPFRGYAGEVIVFASELTANEVYQLYSSTKNKYI